MENTFDAALAGMEIATITASEISMTFVIENTMIAVFEIDQNALKKDAALNIKILEERGDGSPHDVLREYIAGAMQNLLDDTESRKYKCELFVCAFALVQTDTTVSALEKQAAPYIVFMFNEELTRVSIGAASNPNVAREIVKTFCGRKGAVLQ